MVKGQAARMSEKGGPVIMVLGLLSLLWLFAGAPAKVDPIPVDGLIEVTQRASETLEIQYDRETDFAMIDPQPSPSDKHEKARREIIIFTQPNCPPCDQWKRCEQPKFEADGWVVAYCTEHNFTLTPTFIIERDGRTAEHRGYLPFAKIDEVTK